MSMTEHKSTSHDGKHTACQLCQKSNAKMKNPNQMKMQPQFMEAYAWLVRHNPTIDNMACICLPCIKQIQRNHMKEFTPRWLPKAPVPAQACNLQHCKYSVCQNYTSDSTRIRNYSQSKDYSTVQNSESKRIIGIQRLLQIDQPLHKLSIKLVVPFLFCMPYLYQILMVISIYIRHYDGKKNGCVPKMACERRHLPPTTT